MTDSDAIAYIKELMEFNRNEEMITPKNKELGFDIFYQGAFDHAIRALNERISKIDSLSEDGEVYNPCLECYRRYGKEYSKECNTRCEYGKAEYLNQLLKEEMDRPIKTLEVLATQLCCLTECKNCPVHIHGYDKRTEYERTELHEACCSNLYQWIIEQANSVDNKGD